MIKENCIDKNQIKEFNPLALAFMGDGVHTFFVRDYIMKRQNLSAGNFHLVSSYICKAKTQSMFFDKMFEEFSEEEKRVALRARNHKSHTMKNVSLEEYKKATAFEAVLGYLYLLGEKDRLNELLNTSMSIYEKVKERKV